ncbi:pyridoxamine 5'-phosphate oxidase family protein [Mycolicibacterium sp. XJ662]
MSSQLTAEDRELLERPLHGFFTVAAGSTPPQPRPVWFEVTSEGGAQLFSAPDAPKVRQLERDGRASLVVAAPVGERERWVSVTGPTTMERDGARELVERLGARYWDTGDPVRAKELAAMLAQEWVRIVIHPEKVSRAAI